MTYEADFDAEIIGEVEASPVRRADNIIRSVDYRTFDGLHVGERVPTDCGLEYFYDGICTNQLPKSLNRFPVIDCVDEKFARV